MMRKLPWDLVSNPFVNYATFRGRARRAEFWLFMLSAIILFQAVSLISNGIIELSGRDMRAPPGKLWVITDDFRFDSTITDSQRIQWHHRDDKDWHRRKKRHGNDDRAHSDTYDGGDAGGKESDNDSIMHQSPMLDALQKACTDPNLVELDGFTKGLICIDRYHGPLAISYDVNRHIVTRGMVQFGLFLALVIPFCAVTTRRLHDINLVGWWQLVFFVPAVGWLVLLFMMLWHGNEGKNRFGPDPIAQKGK